MKIRNNQLSLPHPFPHLPPPPPPPHHCPIQTLPHLWSLHCYCSRLASLGQQGGDSGSCLSLVEEPMGAFPLSRAVSGRGGYTAGVLGASPLTAWGPPSFSCLSWAIAVWCDIEACGASPMGEDCTRNRGYSCQCPLLQAQRRF